MSRVLVAAAVLLLAPVAARADPIGVMVASPTTVDVQGGSIDLGTLALGPGGTGTFFFNNAKGGQNYQVSLALDLTGLRGFGWKCWIRSETATIASTRPNQPAYRSGRLLDVQRPGWAELCARLGVDAQRNIRRGNGHGLR